MSVAREGAKGTRRGGCGDGLPGGQGASSLWYLPDIPPLSHPQSSDNIPPGYEPISLLEALNGLRSVSPSLPSAPLYDEITYSGVVDGVPPTSRPLVAMDRALEGGHQKGKHSKSPDRSAGHGVRSSCKP